MNFFKNMSTKQPRKEPEKTTDQLINNKSHGNGMTRAEAQTKINADYKYNNVTLVSEQYTCEEKMLWQLPCGCLVKYTGSAMRAKLNLYGKVYCKEHEPLKGNPRKSRSDYEYDQLSPEEKDQFTKEAQIELRRIKARSKFRNES